MKIFLPLHKCIGKKGYISKKPYVLLDMPVKVNLKNKNEEKRQQKYYSKELIQHVLTLMNEEFRVRLHNTFFDISIRSS